MEIFDFKGHTKYLSGGRLESLSYLPWIAWHASESTRQQHSMYVMSRFISFRVIHTANQVCDIINK